MKKLISLLFLPCALLQAQIFTPGANIQGDSQSDFVGIGQGASEPLAPLHLTLNGTEFGFLLQNNSYDQTTFPIEYHLIPNEDVRMRLHYSGRLELGTDFSGYSILGENKLAVDKGLQVFGAHDIFSSLQPDRLRWGNFNSNPLRISYYDQATSTDLDIATFKTDGTTIFDGPVGIGGEPSTNRFQIKDISHLYFTVDAEGNAGIGTENPEARLHIEPQEASGALYLRTHTTQGSVIGEPGAGGGGEVDSEYLIKGDHNSTNKFLLSHSGSIEMAGHLNLSNQIRINQNSDHFIGLHSLASVTGSSLYWGHNQQSGHNSNFTFRFGGSTAPPLLSISPTGNVAIGANATANRFHVKSSSGQNFFMITDAGNARMAMAASSRLEAGTGFSNYNVLSETKLTVDNSLQVFSDADTYSQLKGTRLRWSNDNSTDPFTVSFYNHSTSLDTDVLTITPDGKVGVNTSNTSGNYALFVDGKILTDELTVKLTSDWPDYVFLPNYERMPLEEVEQYIAKNGHLPEVPSAEEVARDGVDVGEMNAILLKKVEELTLELIEMKKEVEVLKSNGYNRKH